MTKTRLSSLLLATTLGLAGPADAALIDRGGGFIYDTVLDITWLADANYARTIGRDADGKMTWTAANHWVSQLRIYDPVRNQFFDDWRMPHIEPRDVPRLPSNDGSTDLGYTNMTQLTELGYMYYVNLGNLGFCTPHGGGNSNLCIEQPGWGLVDGIEANDESLFSNLMADKYWADTTGLSAVSAWYVDLGRGNQYIAAVGSEYYVWAVRDGDVAPTDPVAVPTPATLPLVATAMLAAYLPRRRKPERPIHLRLGRYSRTLESTSRFAQHGCVA
jgi:hypothetical protein